MQTHKHIQHMAALIYHTHTFYNLVTPARTPIRTHTHVHTCMHTHAQLETAMANRRARPSLLLPAWRAVGFAVGTGATALLPSEATAMVGDAIGRAVTEQYDANIRTMYDAGIVQEESEVGGWVGGWQLHDFVSRQGCCARGWWWWSLRGTGKPVIRRSK